MNHYRIVMILTKSSLSNNNFKCYLKLLYIFVNILYMYSKNEIICHISTSTLKSIVY